MAANRPEKKQKADPLIPTLTRHHRVEEAFATILRENFQTMRQWQPVARLGEDIEGVHQMRVVLRRMRSALNLFRKAIPRSVTDRMGEEMRWIGNTLGPARDRDVFMTETLAPMAGKIPLPEGEQAMAALARAFRDEAYVEVRTLLDSERYQNFVAQFPAWIGDRGWRAGDWQGVSDKRLEENIVSYASSILTRRMTVTLAHGARLEEMSGEERHQLRIDCKKLRYATEFFSCLFDRQQMEAFTLALKELQTLLGTLNDVAVLPSLLAELVARDASPTVVQYAGAMIGWRARQAVEVESTLLTRWKAFVRSPQPWQRRRKANA